MAKKDKAGKKNKEAKGNKKAKGPQAFTFLEAADTYSGAATKFTKSASFTLPNDMLLVITCVEGKHDAITLDGLPVGKAIFRYVMYHMHVKFHGNDKEWTGRGAGLKVIAAVSTFLAKNEAWATENGLVAAEEKPAKKDKKEKTGKKDKSGKKEKAGKSQKGLFTAAETNVEVKKKHAKNVLAQMQIGQDQIDDIVKQAFAKSKTVKMMALITATTAVLDMPVKEMRKAFQPLFD